MRFNEVNVGERLHFVWICTIGLIAISSSLLIAGVHSNSSKSPCGNEREVAAKVGQCLVQIMEVAEGRVQKPANDGDLVSLSNRFAAGEKCIRGVARECLTGLHKATTSSVAGASRRFRTSEFKNPDERARYYEPVNCSIKLSKKIIDVYRNHTAIVQGVRDDPALKVEQRFAKGCCIFEELDRELSRIYDAECPQSTHLVLKIVHVLTEDARTTVCLAPKCHNVLKPYVNTKYKPPQELIEPIMEIFYALSSGDD